MTVPAGAPGDEVPQEDWAEQVTEAGPPAEGQPTTPATALSSESREADEADLLEQEQPVDLGDEEQ
ncbi:hypothetical protein GCM10009616_14260 [Microlunatus lacustris]